TSGHRTDASATATVAPRTSSRLARHGCGHCHSAWLICRSARDWSSARSCGGHVARSCRFRRNGSSRRLCCISAQYARCFTRLGGTSAAGSNFMDRRQRTWLPPCLVRARNPCSRPERGTRLPSFYRRTFVAIFGPTHCDAAERLPASAGIDSPDRWISGGGRRRYTAETFSSIRCCGDRPCGARNFGSFGHPSRLWLQQPASKPRIFAWRRNRHDGSLELKATEPQSPSSNVLRRICNDPFTHSCGFLHGGYVAGTRRHASIRRRYEEGHDVQGQHGQRLDEKGHDVERFDEERHDVQGQHVQGQHVKRHYLQTQHKQIR